MRILCLHGVGSNAKILEHQLMPFLKAVDPSHEFVFVDGPVPSPRGPGVSPFLEGPFFSHTAGYSPACMADALDHIEEVIDDYGPFDGVIGFSQGGCVALSYIHQQQVMYPDEPAPFRFALILSSVAPQSADPEFCAESIERLARRGLGDLDMDIGSDTEPGSDSETETGYFDQDVVEAATVEALADPSLPHDDRLLCEILLGVSLPTQRHGDFFPNYDMRVHFDGEPHEVPRPLHGRLVDERISIPTVHVTGKKDSAHLRRMSEVAYSLCEGPMTKRLEHAGAHHPPNTSGDVAALLRAMDWAAKTAEEMSSSHI